MRGGAMADPVLQRRGEPRKEAPHDALAVIEIGE